MRILFFLTRPGVQYIKALTNSIPDLRQQHATVFVNGKPIATDKLIAKRLQIFYAIERMVVQQ